MKKFCLALDLIDDTEMIAEYENYHQNIWPEVRQSILDSGITNMEIYRIQNRLFMIIEADDSFSFEAKNDLDQNNPKVQEWEELMWKFQQQLPKSKEGEKWRLMDRIFSL
ncbi:L-rhamnose mutarotase [Chryseobacterium caseinilyticum]|uniref:L-rhamnose mutarotase n=1 Tax=Chryseobacterium caseinilyticum TaxID=2771428 RepID=A0ABR8Z936_9FLAO|nr:L-rhamnose mutarotase [Chryseobacterium caseinilyticum]MBD8081445.1 L-rhamnose mutarotase [Chryseobacterium caseinilyticum]